MSREQLYCEPCNVSWYDDCTFWTAYRSPCAKCGENREAIINTEFSFADPRMVDGPVSYPKLPYSRSSGWSAHLDLVPTMRIRQSWGCNLMDFYPASAKVKPLDDRPPFLDLRFLQLCQCRGRLLVAWWNPQS